MSTLGSTLARLRNRKGLTQEQIAERTGLSLDWLRRLEQNHLPQAEHQIESLRTAAALGYSLPAFLREAGIGDAAGTDLEGDPGLRELVNNLGHLDSESREMIEQLVRKLARKGNAE